MRMSIFNATAVVPTLARIILCAAFLTMGWNKLMNTAEFTGDRAQVLIDLGVVDSARPNATITTAAFRLDDQQPTDADDTQTEEPAIELPEIPEPPVDVLREDSVTGEQVVQAKRLHTVTIRVHKAGWAQPVLLAWVATMTELIGGALLLIGLFSRVWGLGLAIAMGVAFYLTSYGLLLEMGPFALAADIESGYAAFNRMYMQLSLGVLALGVFLTGPGPLSLDRLLFRPNHRKDAELDDLP